jgi:hypothetical protein
MLVAHLENRKVTHRYGSVIKVKSSAGKLREGGTGATAELSGRYHKYRKLEYADINFSSTNLLSLCCNFLLSSSLNSR